MKLFSVEGNRQRLDGGAMFGNAPRALWSQWLKPGDDNCVELACRALYVDDLEGRRVLFETGIGAFFEPKMRQRYGVAGDNHALLDSLAAIGVAHEDIDLVVLSHLHFDHAGGLLAAWREGQPPALLFPNARYVVGRAAYARAGKPHRRDRASFIPGLAQLLADSGRLVLADGPRLALLGDAVRLHYSDGHTPGLMMSEIGGPRGLVYCSDLVPGRAWMHVPVTMGYDRAPEQLVDEKARFLADMQQRRVQLFFTHDPDCAIAGITRDERGRYVPVDPRPSLAGEHPAFG